MRPRLLAVLLVAAATAPTLAAAAAPPTDAQALDLLLERRLGDGAFENPGKTPLGAVYVAEALAAMRIDPGAWPSRDASVLATLGAPADLQATMRLAHALGAAGHDPARYPGANLTRQILDGFDGVQFGRPELANDDAWAILALRAAGLPRTHDALQKAVLQVRASQAPDGGFGLGPGAVKGNTDLTGMALAALAAAGERLDGDARALAFLDGTRATSGGHVDNAGLPPNCQSTLWALHGYAILGRATPHDETQAFLRRLARDDGGWAYKESATVSDTWCTTEMLTWRVARFPLAGFASAVVTVPTLRATQTGSIAIDGPFTTARWEIDGQEATGLRVGRAFDRPGAYAFHVHATGPGVVHRASGTLLVDAAPPAARLAATELRTLRHEPVTLDATPSGDVALAEFDWGDGATEQGPPSRAHTYASPGAYDARVRVQDAAGEWSAWTRARIDVVNRLPVLSGLPERIVADRTRDVLLAPDATDPDGDTVRVSWTSSDAEGEGSATLRHARLGKHVVTFRADDGWGGIVARDVTIDVVNLPPRLDNVSVPADARAGEPITLVVSAHDPDGPPPAVAWLIGDARHDGASIETSLAAGRHAVVVHATDADGAVREETLALVVGSGAASTFSLANLVARLDGDALVVSFDAEGPATVTWTSDAGAGSVVAEREAVVPLAGATWADVRVEVARDGLTASGETRVARDGGVAALAPPVFDLPAIETRANVTTTYYLLPHPERVAYRFDWGDGNATPWQDAPLASHAWSAPGAYEIVASARASDGRTSLARVVVRVVAPALAEAPLVLEALALAPPPALAEAPGVIELEAPEEARREAPGPGWLAALLAALLALASRGRRSPRRARR